MLIIAYALDLTALMVCLTLPLGFTIPRKTSTMFGRSIYLVMHVSMTLLQGRDVRLEYLLDIPLGCLLDASS